MARHGWSGVLQYGIRDSVFKIEPGWAEQVELKRNFREDRFRSGQMSSYRASMVKFIGNEVELEKAPISIVKFMGKLRNLVMW
jgi:hypothetical protein